MQHYERKKIKKNFESFDICKKWMSGIVTGLQYLHYFHICRLDLKAENIMITTEMRAVIADFSYACKTTDRIRRYGLKVFNRPPEAGNVNGHCTPVQNLLTTGLLECYASTS